MFFLKKIVILFLFLLAWTAILSGCVQDKYDKGAEGVTFSKIAGFTDSNGQARIRLIAYSGEAETANIKNYAERLGCGMLFAYFYPESTERSEIPVEEIEAAQTIVEAREILFKGEGFGKWRFAVQCLTLIPTITDCQESPISSNCR